MLQFESSLKSLIYRSADLLQTDFSTIRYQREGYHQGWMQSSPIVIDYLIDRWNGVEKLRIAKYMDNGFGTEFFSFDRAKSDGVLSYWNAFPDQIAFELLDVDETIESIMNSSLFLRNHAIPYRVNGSDVVHMRASEERDKVKIDDLVIFFLYKFSRGSA